MSEIRAHLDGCEACRARFDGLKAKFSTLDLLREEMGASPALIASTIEAAAGAKRPAILRLWARPWLGAVAAVFVVGVALLVVSTFGPGRKAPQPVTEKSFSQENLSQRTLDVPAAAEPEKLVAADRSLRSDAAAPTAGWQPQAKLGDGAL